MSIFSVPISEAIPCILQDCWKQYPKRLVRFEEAAEKFRNGGVETLGQLGERTRNEEYWRKTCTELGIPLGIQLHIHDMMDKELNKKRDLEDAIHVGDRALPVTEGVQLGAMAVSGLKDLITAPRGAVIEIANITRFPLIRSKQYHFHGGWADSLPHRKIDPNSPFGCSTQASTVSLFGTSGFLIFTCDAFDVVIHWKKPYFCGSHTSNRILFYEPGKLNMPEEEAAKFVEKQVDEIPPPRVGTPVRFKSYRGKAVAGIGDKAHFRYEIWNKNDVVKMLKAEGEESDDEDEAPAEDGGCSAQTK